VSLDTKYRPLRYVDVLGQQATIEVCKQIVREGKGFHQSYVFAGAHGGGKTTTARIMARAMLCESPQDGEPCDECHSCKSILEDRSENFVEVDAATNSGKEHVKRITEEAQFGSFSGKRKIYLFDECHELSKSAMDAMLKPLEDNIRGTEERQLVCLFCTTEPRKMRSAIMSRCAPAFKIQINTPEEIAGRLKYICDAEGLEYDEEVLPLIAEVVECHVRDSIKAIEGVSMLGKIDRENVERYLHLDANALYLDLLESIGTDLPRALATIGKLNERVSPAVTYERMAEVAMMAYRLSHVGTAAVPSYWDKDRLKAAGDLHREFLVEFAQRFAERPSHPTSPMLTCDVATLHQKRAGIIVVAESQQVAVAPATMLSVPTPAATPSSPVAAPEPQVSRTTPPREDAPPTPIEELPKKAPENAAESAKVPLNQGTIQVDPFVNPIGVHIEPKAQQMSGASSTHRTDGINSISTTDFVKVLRLRVFELSQEKLISGRPARRDDVGSS